MVRQTGPATEGCIQAAKAVIGKHYQLETSNDCLTWLWEQPDRHNDGHNLILSDHGSRSYPGKAEDALAKMTILMELLTHIKITDERAAARMWYFWRAVTSKPAVLETLRHLVFEASFNWELSLPEFQDVVQLLTTQSVEVRLRSAPNLLNNWPEPKDWLRKLRQISNCDALDQPLHHHEIEPLLQSLNETNCDHFPEGHRALQNPFDQATIASYMNELEEKFQDCAPNTIQLLYAQYISYSLQDEQAARVGVFMGPGMGKSRLSFVIGWYSLSLGIMTEVTFVYPNEYLMKREEKKFKPAFMLMGLEAKVRWTTNDKLPAHPTNGPKKSNLHVFDEGDKPVMENPAEFDRVTKNHPVVLLTATPGTRAFEKMVLSFLNFKM